MRSKSAAAPYAAAAAASSPFVPLPCPCSPRYYQAPYPPPCLRCFPPPICLPPPIFLNASWCDTSSCSAALQQNPRQSFPSSQTPSSLKASPWIAPFHLSGNGYYHAGPTCLMPSCIGSSCPPCPCFFYVSPCPRPLAAANCFLGASSKPFAAQASEIDNVSATPAHDADMNGNYAEQSVDIGQAYPNIDQFNDLQDRHDEGEQDGEEDDPQFILTDEWVEYFAKSEARRRERKAQLKKKKQAARKEVRLSSPQDELHVPTLVSADNGASLEGSEELKAALIAGVE